MAVNSRAAVSYRPSLKREIASPYRATSDLSCWPCCVRKDRYSSVPFRTRFQIAEILKACAKPKSYYDVFDLLLEDSEPRVRNVAKEAIRAIERV